MTGPATDPVPDAAPGPAADSGAVADAPPADDAAAEHEDATVTGIKLLVARGKDRVAAGQSKANELLEQHRDRPLLDVGLRIFYRDRESAGTVVGSAIAFRLFLFFVPLLLFMVGVAGFLASTVGQDDLDQAGITGSLAVQINTALTQPNSTRWLAVGIGLVGMATTGRSLSKVMVTASCLAWRLPVKAKASVRVIGAIVGMIAGIGLVATAINRIRAELGLAVAGFSFLLAFAIYALAWIFLSLMLPRDTTDPGALIPGAIVVGATLTGMQAVSQLYLPDRFDRASQLYGAIGTTIVTLGWFFILGRAMMLAMSINAVIYERFGSISQFVFSLPVLRALPRRSERIRRFFELDR